ncbi:4-(cytidine 5'-diphospho)-2-C-methyl-D-erythritol kinase [Marinilabiliaceae bacterium JC017]|nr:4-(cytidine 5'-diphospho)-2-C-methyl-D-erythritol kinase [Marinilabiliaceae bacterium JC017]
MICFPNAKINLGLNIINKRSDGYHNIETVFLPIGLRDVLEVVHNCEGKQDYTWGNTGIVVDTPPENNICIKALRLMQQEVALSPIQIHLHKHIPFGAGLGGGSADAAFMLKLLNDFFELSLSNEKLKEMAVKLGADCSFFVDNMPAYATGIGEIMEPVTLNLEGYHLVLIVPDIHVSTPEAYSLVVPKKPDVCVKDSIKRPVEEWKDSIKNDFEISVFSKYPAIAELKQMLYDKGAVYASMSGSGSSVYGIFREEPELKMESGYMWQGAL